MDIDCSIIQTKNGAQSIELASCLRQAGQTRSMRVESEGLLRLLEHWRARQNRMCRVSGCKKNE
jgi:hypothetical protein